MKNVNKVYQQQHQQQQQWKCQAPSSIPWQNEIRLLVVKMAGLRQKK